MSILIKNGRIVTAEADFMGDILVEGEIIQAIGQKLNAKADRVIDATDKLIFPGGIDPHVHLDMPFMGTYSSDDYTSGTTAALYGGTTMVIDFILQTQGDSLANALNTWQKKSKDKACCDYSYHMAVTDFNKNTKREIKGLIRKKGITSFKTFMAYKGALMIDDNQMVRLMNEVKKHGGMVTVHATNGDMIDYLVSKFRSEKKFDPLYHYLSQPEITEAEASSRFTDMAHFTEVHSYIVHMTCEGALNAIRKAGYRNQMVFGETCIQYLLLDASLYERGFESAKWVMSPPLRLEKDREALWAGINQGLIQVVGTDHCPFTLEQKKMGTADFSKIPNGHPAIEHRMELLFSEGVLKDRINLNTFVAITSTNAAKIFGIHPKKGCLAPGSEADILIFNPHTRHTISVKTHHHQCDYSAYEGWEVVGKCETVLLRGQVALDKRKLKAAPGTGKFVKRDTVSKTI